MAVEVKDYVRVGAKILGLRAQYGYVEEIRKDQVKVRVGQVPVWVPASWVHVASKPQTGGGK